MELKSKVIGTSERQRQ
jgi:hypothetical protein